MKSEYLRQSPPLFAAPLAIVRSIAIILAAIIGPAGFASLPAARAELPSIRLDRLTPLGGAAGSTVEVEVAGADLEQLSTLLFDHPGLTAEPLADKERRFQVRIAADVPPGTYDVRLVGRWGVSNPRLFAVTHGLRDVAESEPNNVAAEAQRVEINAAINGQSDGNNVDLYSFVARAGQRLVVDCQAGRLDSPLDATMSLEAADGRLLASSSDYRGRDPLIDFLVPADGEYRIRVHDLSYRGGFPYRLLVTDQPHLETVYPAAVTSGRQVDLNVVGRNLGADSTPFDAGSSDLPLQQLRVPFTAPADTASLGLFTFHEHPTDHSVLPTAATCTLTGCQWRLPDPAALGAQTLLVTSDPVHLEAEPNDQPPQAQAVSLPAVVAGRFDRPRDADWFELEAPENGQYALEVYCERIRGGADPYLVVVDDQGNRLNELDDFGHRINAFDGHLRDPVGMVNLSAGRKYRVLVQDRYRRGGAGYQYVLSVRQPVPDFYAAVIHSQNPGPGGTTVWRGGAVYLDVVIHQRDGFNGPITLTAEDLPAGLHIAPTVVNNNSRGTLVVWADDEAPEFTGPIRLVATGEHNGQVIRREVRGYTRVWNDAGMNSSRPTRELVVAVRDSSPYRLEWTQAEVEVRAGGSLDLQLNLHRRWPDLTADVTIQPLAFPGNFQLSNASFSGGQRQLHLPLQVQAGTRPGLYTLAVLGQAQVPFHKDAAATERPNTLVSLPSRPLTVRVLAAEPSP
ncbi:MAG: PPC domain-containing protein [Pirellulaceae bacterium]|nr:PPC domain-containing protein [Pirellulaceae bacterium]